MAVGRTSNSQSGDTRRANYADFFEVHDALPDWVKREFSDLSLNFHAKELVGMVRTHMSATGNDVDTACIAILTRFRMHARKQYFDAYPGLEDFIDVDVSYSPAPDYRIEPARPPRARRKQK